MATVALAVALALFGVPVVERTASGALEGAAFAADDADDAGNADSPADEADRKAAEAVAALVKALPSPDAATVDVADAYAKAKKAHDDLTQAQRQLIAKDDEKKLEAVGKAIEADRQRREQEAAAAAKAAADEAAAAAVVSQIAALPAAANATVADAAAVNAAQQAYAALTADQKAIVGPANQEKLAAVAAAVAAAQAAADEAASQAAAEEAAAREAKVKADKDAAKKVTALIAALPSAKKATASDEAAAKAAKQAYDNLTADQKAYVSQANRDKLSAVLKAAAEDRERQESSQQGSTSGGTGQGGDSGSQGSGEGDSTGGSGTGAGSGTGSESGTGTGAGSGPDTGTGAGSGTASPVQFTPGSNVRKGASLDPNSVYQIDLYATTTNADGNWVKPVLDDEADAQGLRWLKSGIKEKGGRLKLLVRAAWGDGRAFWQYDEDWRTMNLRYASSNTGVATVSSSGVVTATGDGEVVLSVTDTASGLVAYLGLRVAGQQGAYVTEVQVCDATGRAYGDERITFDSTANKLNLYVRQVLSDNTTVSNAPQASDYAPAKLTPTVWSVGDSDIGSVNSETGVFIPSALGSVKVYATSTGGDPDVKEGKVRGFVWVVIDDGDYGSSGDMPSDSLTVNVIYDAYDQRKPDGGYQYIVKTQHYSIAELKGIESSSCTYTLTRSDGAYATSSAQGIHLLTLIERTGVDISQVKSFTFTALDGVNPGKMTYAFLFGERYYWPNYEFGGNLSGAVNVFPMLAWASDWRDSKSGAEDSSANYSNLPTGTCLRLLFGSSTTADNKTDHSLKYISEMTIRIAGAPDITDGAGEDGTGNGDEAGGVVVAGDDGGGSGGDDAQSAGDQQGEATGETDGEAAQQQGPSADADAETAEDAAQKKAAEIAEAVEQVMEGGAETQGEPEQASQRWHAYQMLNPEDDSHLQIDDLKDNPLQPWAIGLMGIALALGATGSGVSFHRQLAGFVFQRKTAFADEPPANDIE